MPRRNRSTAVTDRDAQRQARRRRMAQAKKHRTVKTHPYRKAELA